MTSPQLRISSKFPEGYGDFAIQSSDDGICYFPSALLSHMSCVFRDMLSLGGPSELAKASTAPLKITETLDVLELFLVHLDPEHFPPSIDPDTIEDLLQMAEKYQTLKITRWFEREATAKNGNIDTEVKEPFIITHPVIVLSLACQFRFQNLGRMAMRELIGCHYSVLYDHTRYFDPIIHRELYRLRHKRTIQYSKWIRELVTNPGSVQGCGHCTDEKAIWVGRMVSMVTIVPCWKYFTKWYEHGRSARCANCDTVWPSLFDDKIPGWKEIAEKEEKALPEWPVQNADKSS